MRSNTYSSRRGAPFNAPFAAMASAGAPGCATFVMRRGARAEAIATLAEGGVIKLDAEA